MLVPGNINPLLLALAGDPLDELGKIDRSIRLRATASAYLGRTFGAAGNQKAFAWSAWVKRGEIRPGILFGNVINNMNYMTVDFGFLDSDPNSINVVFASGNIQYGRLKTIEPYRDPSAHFHVYIEVDTKHATASERLRLFVNGERITALQNTIYPAQGTDMPYMNTAIAHRIGNDSYYTTYQFDGQISHPAFFDGQPPGVSAFGFFHPRTGQWRPKSKAAVKAVIDAGGANSFFLPLEDTTNTTTLCTDASAKGNNWTANNVSLTPGVTYDSMLDTPTNNFPTIDPNFAAYGFVAGTIRDGGLKFSSSATYHFTPCTIPLPSAGKWFAEFIPQDAASSLIGLADLDNGSGASQNIGGGYGWYGTTLYTGNVVAVQSGLPYPAAGDKITVAVDMDTLSARWYQNGILRITQVLAAGKRYAFACGDSYAPGATSCYANFGQAPVSFTPTGHMPLCTKNLALPKIAKSSSAFVSVADSGGNIAAKLAAARAGWSGYIDIIKRRDAAEGWRWIFSDDPGYYLDSSAAAAKAAVPAFGGTAYVGYSLKVSALNGVATGRLIHTAGVADTVSDGLVSIRKAIILVSEDGSNWFFYHPELTAGKLLYLNSTSPETTDPTIGSVTASGFTVAASIPTGTYRWIAIQEVEGFTKLGKYAGNSSTDGPSNYCLESPAFNAVKVISGYTSDWINWDSAREKANVQNTGLFFNSNAPESVAASEQIDALGNGFKLRSSSSRVNLGGMYVYLSIAAFPFRYANAR